MLLEKADRKSIQNLIIGFSTSKRGRIETWNVLEEMLLHFLKKDIEGTETLTKYDLFATIHSLTMRKAQNKEIWSLLMKQVVKKLNTHSLDLKDLSILMTDL